MPMTADARHLRRWSIARLGHRVWEDEDGAAAVARAALLPAELLFRTGTRVRQALYDRAVLRSARAAAPVISIGNLTVGGTGKTPFARHVVDRLLARGARPAILHGGYGADEPALHRQWHPHVPVLVGRDRVASARAAVAQGADVVVLDDGFQHRRLARDLDIVLVAAESCDSPVRLLPRGPWREPLAALRRADLVVVTRRTATGEAARAVAAGLHRFATGSPIVIAELRADRWRDLSRAPAEAPAGEAFAVTAIARPTAFLANARSAGADVRDGIAFPDHHEFTHGDVRRIVAAAADRTLVVTEKDAVKLAPLLPATAARVLLQRVLIEQGEADLESALDAWT
jgi:tetraacyldisaccharide 4'-kinase